MLFGEYNDRIFVTSVTPESLDQFLAFGYRHFGNLFFRSNTDVVRSNSIHNILPLRIVLENFKLSKSQKKTKQKNQDLIHYFEPLNITPEIEELFFNHRRRFKEHIPKSLFTFLGGEMNPTEIVQCIVRDGKKLVAASFLDLGKYSTSSIYGMFDLEYSKQRLGIYTMLLEIEYSIQLNKIYYYPGYAYKESSFYDYKKTFYGLEYLNWDEIKWLPYERIVN